MLPALLTTLLWSVSVVCATRSTQYLGSAVANLTRLCLATVLLAAWAHGFGEGLSGARLRWFVFSGFIGFGLGDLALYEALPRLGSRLTLLLMQCLAAPIGTLIEWVWLGTTLTGAQIVAGLIILTGVAVALAPKNHVHLDRRRRVGGTIFGVLAAIGQGGGAVLSRKAFLVTAQAGQGIDGGLRADHWRHRCGGDILRAAAGTRHANERSRSRGMAKGLAVGTGQYARRACHRSELLSMGIVHDAERDRAPDCRDGAAGGDSVRLPVRG